MIKTITININFIGEGEVKRYVRVIDNFGASDFPTIKEFTEKIEEVYEELNLDTKKPGLSDL